MHFKVVAQLLQLAPKKIVYVSCNSATQARDLALLKKDYHLKHAQAVDMFPQTHHIENIVLLTPMTAIKNSILLWEAFCCWPAIWAVRRTTFAWQTPQQPPLWS